MPISITDRNGRVALLAATVLCSAFTSAAAAQTVTRTDWQMYVADEVQYDPSGAQSPFNGAQESYRFASIPPQNPDAGQRQWQPAPDPQIINYLSVNGDEVSRIINDPANCRRAFDYAYFQTIVTVPPDTAVSAFRIDFDGMDDGSRITIFNTAYPSGTPDLPNGINNFVRYGEQASMDLAQFLTAGDNRVVITQVDDCPSGNKFRSAQVTLNGSVVAAPEHTTDLPPFLTVSQGDVHVKTFDGLRYDFQTPGDFLLMSNADGTMVLQERNVPYPNTPGTSVTEAAAMMVDGDRIEIYFPDHAVYINGEAFDVTDVYTRGRTITHQLPQGALLTISPSRSSVTYLVDRYGYGLARPNNYHALRIIQHNLATSHSVQGNRYLADPWVLGLTGIFDGNPANDLTARDGEMLTLPAAQAEIERIGATWRVSGADSLFVMRPADPPVKPVPSVELVNLDVGVRTEAAVACATNGVNDIHLLRDCTYDVAATGDAGFALAAADMQADLTENPDPREPEVATGIAPADDIGPEALAAAQAATGGQINVPNAVAPEPAEAEQPEAEQVAVAPEYGVKINMERDRLYEMEGYNLIFQNDGNLCIYTVAENRWIWCVNNDPNVRFGETASVVFTTGGQLIGKDANGGVLYAYPAEPTNEASNIRITVEGVMEIFADNIGVRWSSK